MQICINKSINKQTQECINIIIIKLIFKKIFALILLYTIFFNMKRIVFTSNIEMTLRFLVSLLPVK